MTEITLQTRMTLSQESYVRKLSLTYSRTHRIQHVIYAVHVAIIKTQLTLLPSGPGGPIGPGGPLGPYQNHITITIHTPKKKYYLLLVLGPQPVQVSQGNLVVPKKERIDVDSYSS